MSTLYLEVTDDTLVATERGVVRLRDILHRSVEPSLWAICWRFGGNIRNGISFHRSHKEARDFAHAQVDNQPDGPARLVKVSQWLADKVNEEKYYWTNLSTFEEAETYEGQCNH